MRNLSGVERNVKVEGQRGMGVACFNARWLQEDVW